MNVSFVTFGCRLSRAESLDLEARYAAAGWSVVRLGGSVVPDEIVLRGCSVTAKAQRDCEKKIAQLRERFPQSRIRILGCLPNAEKDIPFAKHTSVGFSNIAEDNSTSTSSDDDTICGGSGRALPLATSRAYLKVQDGCSGRCAFCIVPQFRGPPRSSSFAEVVSRARAFLDAGFREIVVTGCNLALYRSEGRGLPELLAALAELSSFHRVRLGSLEPGICDAALLDAMASHPNVCRHVHLSLQSASDRILARMNRPYHIAQVAAFCADATRRLGARLALGADVICGFPGETEEDFAATRAFLNGSFTHLHVFPYSERPGTPAATMDGAVPRALRLERVRILEQDAARRAQAFRDVLATQEVEICVEKDGTGYSDEYVRFPVPAGAPRRTLVRFTPSLEFHEPLPGVSGGVLP